MFENSVTKAGGAETSKFGPIPQFGDFHGKYINDFATDLDRNTLFIQPSNKNFQFFLFLTQVLKISCHIDLKRFAQFKICRQIFVFTLTKSFSRKKRKQFLDLIHKRKLTLTLLRRGKQKTLVVGNEVLTD